MRLILSYEGQAKECEFFFLVDPDDNEERMGEGITKVLEDAMRQAFGPRAKVPNSLEMGKGVARTAIMAANTDREKMIKSEINEMTGAG